MAGRDARKAAHIQRTSMETVHEGVLDRFSVDLGHAPFGLVALRNSCRRWTLIVRGSSVWGSGAVGMDGNLVSMDQRPTWCSARLPDALATVRCLRCRGSLCIPGLKGSPCRKIQSRYALCAAAGPMLALGSVAVARSNHAAEQAADTRIQRPAASQRHPPKRGAASKIGAGGMPCYRAQAKKRAKPGPMHATRRKTGAGGNAAQSAARQSAEQAVDPQTPETVTVIPAWVR